MLEACRLDERRMILVFYNQRFQNAKKEETGKCIRFCSQMMRKRSSV